MFCKKIKPQVKTLLQKFEDKVLQQSLDIALKTTTQLRLFLNKDVTIRVVELTAWVEDDQLRHLLLEVIDASVTELVGAKACRNLPTADERLACYRSHLNNLGKIDQLDDLRKLAVTIVMKLHRAAEGRSFYNAAFELFYLLFKKG